eukprot:g24909.t1
MVHRTPWLWSEPHGLGLTHSQIDSNALANFQEQNLYTVAPLLLAKPTAKRLLKQAQKEAEAQMQEGLRMEPFRRKARVKETLSTAPTQELEQEDDSDDSLGAWSISGARRRWSDQRLNAMLQRDWSPISSPRVTTRKGKVRSTQRGTEPHKQHDLEFQPEHLQWHPTVQELLNSVSTGAKRLKTTVRVNAMQRSASDTKLSPLPRVSASPQRGMRKEHKPRLRPQILARLRQKKLLLESHHSRPQYVIKVMTWKGRNQSNGRWQSWQDWKSDQGQEKEKDKKKKEPSVARSQKSEVLELISYDGKRVALPDDKGAVGSSSASSSGLQEENKRLKDALKYFANKKEDEEVPEDYRPFLHEDPRESLRVQQRELNKQKKMIGRVEKIRSTMEEKSQRWVRWKARIMRGLELEEQRYKEEYKQLEDELQAVETGKDVPMDLENVGTDGHGGVEDELTEVKHQVGQMADYMQRIEKRNLDLTLQVQDLITAVREAKQCDVLQTSPQKPIRGSGFTLPIEVLPSRQGDKSRSSSKERSRSTQRQ